MKPLEDFPGFLKDSGGISVGFCFFPVFSLAAGPWGQPVSPPQMTIAIGP